MLMLDLKVPSMNNLVPLDKDVIQQGPSSFKVTWGTQEKNETASWGLSFFLKFWVYFLSFTFCSLFTFHYSLIGCALILEDPRHHQSRNSINQKFVGYLTFIKNSQGWAIFQWECVNENSKKAKDAKKRKDRGDIPRASAMASKMSTKKICAISFAYSSALKPRPKKEMEGEKLARMVNG